MKCWLEIAAYISQLGLLHTHAHKRKKNPKPTLPPHPKTTTLSHSTTEVLQNIILECFGIGDTRERNPATLSATFVFLVRLVFTRIVIYFLVVLVRRYYAVEDIAPIFRN